jgi:hypothetical protein
MTQILLRELSSSDIDWMTLVGRRLEMRAGDHLLQAGEDPDALYVSAQ